MAEDLDLSALEEVPEGVEEKLSPPWKRILAALRKLREAERRG